jgi:general stress protein CsbA
VVFFLDSHVLARFFKCVVVVAVSAFTNDQFLAVLWTIRILTSSRMVGYQITGTRTHVMVVHKKELIILLLL